MVDVHSDSLSHRFSRNDDAALSPAAASSAKRALDVAISVLLLAFLAPLLLILCALVALDSPGPVLFAQRRTGYGGQVIQVLKLRTMCCLEDGDAVRAVARNDGRVTRVGRWLRRTSLDELPQLINVLRGEMSLVGPRPHALVHDRLWRAEVAGYDRRFRARPGITGLAQIAGLRGRVESVEGVRDRVRADTVYIETWSLRLDLIILVRTLWTVIAAPGGV